MVSLGMRLRQANGQIPAGLNADEDILEYNGGGAHESSHNRRLQIIILLRQVASSTSCSTMIAGN
jgi:hypothetical protein